MSQNSENSPVVGQDAPNAENRNSIHHRCAKWALLALLIGVVLGVITYPLRETVHSRLGLVISGAIPSAFFLASFPLGIVTLFGIPRYGTKGLLMRGLVATLIPIALFGSAFFAFKRVREVASVARARAVAAEINHSAPKYVDPLTTIVGAEFVENQKRLKVRFAVGVAGSQIDRGVWDTQMVPALRTNFEKTIFSRLRDMGIIIAYRYVSQDGELIGEVVFNPKSPNKALVPTATSVTPAADAPVAPAAAAAYL